MGLTKGFTFCPVVVADTNVTFNPSNLLVIAVTLVPDVIIVDIIGPSGASKTVAGAGANSDGAGIPVNVEFEMSTDELVETVSDHSTDWSPSDSTTSESPLN